jgi:predicted CXXCH cytochrome family protein
LTRSACTLALPGVAAAAVILFGPAALRGQDAASCLECHALPDQSLALPSGETRSVTLDADAFAASAHGEAGLDCLACHTEHAEYPHPEVKEQTSRDYVFARAQSCEACHEDQAREYADGVHKAMRANGKPQAATCGDCHDPHAGRRLTDGKGTLLPEARLAVPQTCARCHGAIYEQYKGSAHGAALIGEGNPDVPTCISCHGVHKIADPRTVRFRLDSPLLCASCHTDAAKMKKYGLSTAVLRTYVADFHGSTVTLFQKAHPDQQTNKPVCYDCHGVHDIPHTSDPQKGIRTKENLLRTCQQCHPTATANFPDSWMSHFIPDRERAPAVFWLGWLYRVLIPGTIGGMLVFVVADFARRQVDKRRARASAPPPGEGRA